MQITFLFLVALSFKPPSFEHADSFAYETYGFYGKIWFVTMHVFPN